MNKNEAEPKSSTNHNKNEVKVNNQLNITINFGDSLNLLALVTGVVILRKFFKRKSE